MADNVDILLKFWEEQWAQARQCENQRSIMANFIISIFTAGIGIIVISDFAFKTLPIAFFLAVLSVFGGLFSAKLFERWRLHERRAIKWSEKIDELAPEAELLKKFWEAHREHKDNHPKMKKIALFRLWEFFYFILTGLALIVSAYIIIQVI